MWLLRTMLHASERLGDSKPVLSSNHQHKICSRRRLVPSVFQTYAMLLFAGAVTALQKSLCRNGAVDQSNFVDFVVDCKYAAGRPRAAAEQDRRQSFLTPLRHLGLRVRHLPRPSHGAILTGLSRACDLCPLKVVLHASRQCHGGSGSGGEAIFAPGHCKASPYFFDSLPRKNWQPGQVGATVAVSISVSNGTKFEEHRPHFTLTAGM